MPLIIRRHFLLLLLIAVLAPFAVARSAEGWTADVAAAFAQAKKERKPMLLDFTGTAWCPACVALEKEVLSTKEFQAFVKDKLVLAKVDFPSPFEATAEKLALAKEHLGGTEFAFPSVVVFDRDGKKLGVVGYMEGGPAPFIGALNKLLAPGKSAAGR